tara:strand:+ start:498 stop:755 length:258 start_codon:yes stop_codon:yes gene_type:complete
MELIIHGLIHTYIGQIGRLIILLLHSIHGIGTDIDGIDHGWVTYIMDGTRILGTITGMVMVGITGMDMIHGDWVIIGEMITHMFV